MIILVQNCDSKYREICFNRAFIITQNQKYKKEIRVSLGMLQDFLLHLVLAESAEGGREIAKKQPTLVGSLK